MRYFRSVFLILLFSQIGPATILAETGLSAGFAPNSVWLSHNNPVAGDSVNIFSVLYNSSENSIKGDLVFTVDGVSVGTKSFTLSSGQSKVESLPWTATVGVHTLSAKIEKLTDTKTNTSISVLNQTTGSQTVSIKPAPPPPPPVPPSQATQVLNTVVSGVQTGIASSAPIVKNILGSIYNTTESLRTNTEKALAKQVEKSEDVKNTQVSASSTVSAKQNPEVAGIIPKTQKYLAGVMFTVVSSKFLFYSALILSIIFIFLMLRMILKDRKRRL